MDDNLVTVTIKLIVRNHDQENALNSELRHSEILNNWPVFAWDCNDSTDEEIEWFKEQYDADD